MGFSHTEPDDMSMWSRQTGKTWRMALKVAHFMLDPAIIMSEDWHRLEGTLRWRTTMVDRLEQVLTLVGLPWDMLDIKADNSDGDTTRVRIRKDMYLKVWTDQRINLMGREPVAGYPARYTAPIHFWEEAGKLIKKHKEESE